ncbi:MAG: uL15 family ribosomal protein [Clostridia bacterium]|nr:uL15 family ribosomal protein [Clostridia bacterium]
MNLGLISEKFKEGDVVDIKALKAKNLLDKKYARVKILSNGKIDKALTVKADDFSNDAVKMILLVGGTVVKVK